MRVIRLFDFLLYLPLVSVCKEGMKEALHDEEEIGERRFDDFVSTFSD